MKPTYKINLVKNKSITYILPYLIKYFDFSVTTGLLNTYINYEENDKVFCIMYKWSSDPDFLKFEGKIMDHPLFVGHIDYGKNVVYKFKLPMVVSKGVEKFIKGKYVEFSDEHKKAVLDHMKSMGYKNTYRIQEIMDPDGKLSSDAPTWENETLSNHVEELVFNVDNPF